MINDQRSTTITSTRTTPTPQAVQDLHPGHNDDRSSPFIRDVHPLTNPHREIHNHRSSSLAMALSTATEGTSDMSREFNSLVLADSTQHENPHEETNPLAIVPDADPTDHIQSSPDGANGGDDHHGNLMLNATDGSNDHGDSGMSIHRLKKEEVETKISAWQHAKIAKINNRFKRDDAIINGWEGEQVQKANSSMKKVERKLEEKRAKAAEKMHNEIAKARQKAEERRASAEGKRGTKVGRVVEIANLMRAVGRPPAKRSFF